MVRFDFGSLHRSNPMKWRSKRELAVEHGMRFIGLPYYWGGQGPAGFDCSGLMVEMFRACGMFKRGEDLNAQGMYDRWKMREVPPGGMIHQGCLVFYGRSTEHITHVEMVVGEVEHNSLILLGAVGGGSGTDTMEEAQARDAMVTLRPARKDRVAVVDPFDDGA